MIVSEDLRQRPPGENRWLRKFRCALRGVRCAVRSQINFVVHLSAVALVIVLGVVLDVSSSQWCLLVLCMATVLAAELFNTALEHLARAVTREHHDEIRDALDTSSGAVLVVSLGAAIVGGLIFAQRLWAMFQ